MFVCFCIRASQPRAESVGTGVESVGSSLESVPNEPTLLQNKLQILVLKRDWEQVLSLGQAMMEAEINFEASANAVQMAQDALEGRVTTSPLALEVQAILRRYDDGDREESLREMKAVYERDPQQFVVVVSYVRMLLVEEQRSLALEILDAFEISNPRVEEAIRQLRVTASTSDPIEAIVLFHKDEMEQNPQQGRSPYFVTSSLCKPTQPRPMIWNWPNVLKKKSTSVNWMHRRTIRQSRNGLSTNFPVHS